MKKLREIVGGNLKEYSGRKAFILNRDLSEGKLVYIEPDRYYFLSNNIRFDGERINESLMEGYQYSWKLNADMLNGYALDEDEPDVKPTIEFSKIYINDNKLKFKLTQKSYESISKFSETGGIYLSHNVFIYFGEDKSNTINSDDSFLKFNLKETMMTVSSCSKNRLKNWYRFLLALSRTKEIEGVVYKVITPYKRGTFSDKVMYINGTRLATPLENKEDYSYLCNEFLKGGYVFNINCNTLDEYKEKAHSYLSLLLNRFYNIEKDDCGDYFPYSCEIGVEHTSKSGKNYIYARRFKESEGWDSVWILKDTAMWVYEGRTDGKQSPFVDNEDTKKKVVETTFSKKLITKASSYFVDNAILGSDELDKFTFNDELTGKTHLKENGVEVNGYWYNKSTI